MGLNETGGGLALEAERLAHKYFKSKENLTKRIDLPVSKCWPRILESIDQTPITIIIGSTGCGKTTQVPQLLLEEQLYRKRELCRIVITQPRRIAARTVAKTVCTERSWEVGTICGYQVGMDRCISEDSCIQYVTTNVLVERIIHHGNFGGYTHIIVDEIHERHQDLDCLLYLLKSLSAKAEPGEGTAPRLILMSATVESQIYVNYFGTSCTRVVNVGGEMHSVEKIYLDDLSADLRRDLQPRNCLDRRSISSSQEIPKPGVGSSQLKAVVRLISDLEENEARSGSSRGAVLIFLPGLADIKAMIRCFESDQNSRFVLVTLHSTTPMEEQNRAFKIVPPSKRKVIVATNIAESSITVPDVRYVVDFCLTKTQVIDRSSGFASFQTEFCSRASCDQRAGRAGRVQDGVVYRLLLRRDYDRLPEFSEPDILRSPIDLTVLKLKKFGLSSPKRVLAEFISPPRSEDVARAIIKLKEVQALQLEHNGRIDLDDGDLTIIGQVMASLPLDVRLSKLILMGFAFGCFEECIKMAACLSVEDLLVQTPDPMETYKRKLDWAKGHFSDPLLLMNIFDEYLAFQRSRDSYGSIDALRNWVRSQGLNLRRLSEVSHLYQELRDRLSRIGFSKPEGPNRSPREPQINNFFILMALCGSFYPHYYVQRDIDYARIREEVGNNNPLTTMIIKNLPHEYGQLYSGAIRTKLSDCLSGNEEFDYKGSDAFLLLKTDDIAKVPITAYLVQKYHRIHRRIKLPKICSEHADRMLRETQSIKDESAERANETEQPQLRKPPLPRQAHFDGFIAWWDPDNAFQLWLHLQERESQFLSLSTEIEDFCGQPNVTLSPIEVSVGMFVLANHGHTFSRARVVSLSNDGIRVFFIDYGNSALVREVYRIPACLVLANHEAPFAYRAQLAKVQSHDGQPVKPTVFQMLQQDKRCRVELYSIVGGILRIDLFVESLGEEIHINEKLRYDRVAVLLEEPTVSLESHELDVKADVSLGDTTEGTFRGDAIAPVDLYLDIEIGSPFSPLVENCHLDTLNRVREIKGIYIVEQSINNVLFGDTGFQKRFVVAHSERLSTDRQIQLLRTTLMPKLNMMLPFVALIFSPRAEYRCNDQRTAYVGAVCGLGGVEGAGEEVKAAYPEGDLEITFSHELGRQDVKLINRIRSLLNEAFCGNNQVFEWTSVPILRIQDKLIQKITTFFNDQNRSPLKVPGGSERPEGRSKWSQAANKYDAQNQSKLRQALFRPHNIVPIGTKSMFKLLGQTEDFMKASRGMDNLQIILCPLCVKVFGSQGEARAHMLEEEHRIIYEKLRGAIN